MVRHNRQTCLILQANDYSIIEEDKRGDTLKASGEETLDENSMNIYLIKKATAHKAWWLKSLTKGMMKWSKIRSPDAADSSGH